MINRATVFSENLTAIADGDFAIVRLPSEMPMPKPPAQQDNPLGDYVRRVMQENGLDYVAVAKMSKRRGGEIGKSTIQQIVTGKTTNPGVYTLRELAWGLGRPVEELISVALGAPLIETQSFKNSDWGNLADMYRQLPPHEQRNLKRYCLQVLEREFRLILTQLSDSE